LHSAGEAAGRGETATAWRAPRGFAIQERGAAGRWLGEAIGFDRDWQGQQADAGRRTEVRLLWTSETLFLRFDCRYRTLTVFPAPGGRPERFEGLWKRDVAEAFLRPHPELEPPRYREFEIAPNGLWLDLDINWAHWPPRPSDPPNLYRSGLTSAVWVQAEARRWVAELAISMRALTRDFDPGRAWRANFFRVEGQPQHFYSWQATGTPKPQFHVPAAFGWLRFARSR